jgi:hypothetical protein
MDCILHIGANKAGSTSIQKTLSDHSEDLKKQNFYYINTGRTISGSKIERHIGFRFAMTPADCELPGLLPQHNLDTANSRMKFSMEFGASFERELYSIPQNGTVVLSDEDLFNFSSKALAKKSQLFLQNYFSDVNIVFYVRRPDRYVTSFYSQHIKMGGALDLSEIVDQYMDYRRYYDVLEDWIEAFGRSHIKIGTCEQNFLYMGNIIPDFCKRTGILLDVGNAPNLNPKLSATGCEILRIINQSFGYGYERVPRIFRQILETQFSGDGHYLSRDMLERIYAANIEDHKRLISAFDLEEGKDIYRLEDILAEQPSPPPEPEGVSAAQVANVMLEMYRHPDLPKPRAF